MAKYLKYLLYLLCALACSQIHAAAQHNDRQTNIRDIDFIYNTLVTNHPGQYNEFDLMFRSILLKEYQNAKQKTEIGEESHQQIINRFIGTFHDPHLWVQWIKGTEEGHSQKPQTRINDKFSLREYLPNIKWITLPTFSLTPELKNSYNRLLQKLGDITSNDVLVFDLRGNSGGSTQYGMQVIQNIWGEHVTDDFIDNGSIVDWRASLDNLIYLQGLDKDNIHGAWLQKIVHGLQQSIEQNELYYREEIVYRGDVPNIQMLPCYIIIDHNNYSAALNFIDALQILNLKPILVGESTSLDSIYMEIRPVSLPSGLGELVFPIKMYHKRFRKANMPYTPDIACNTDSTEKILQAIMLHSAQRNKSL